MNQAIIVAITLRLMDFFYYTTITRSVMATVVAEWR